MIRDVYHCRLGLATPMTSSCSSFKFLSYSSAVRRLDVCTDASPIFKAGFLKDNPFPSTLWSMQISQHSFVLFDVLERRYAKQFVPYKGSKVGLGFQRQTVLSALQDHKLSLLARNIIVPRLVDVYFLLSV